VLVKIADIWVLENFIIADMTKTNAAQIILGRPFLATLGCNINVKKGWLTFEVEGCYAMFYFMDEIVVSPNSSQSDAFPLSPEIYMEDVLNCQDSPEFDWISTKDLDQGYIKIEFTTPTPPSVPEVEAYASNESPMSDYYRFTEVVLAWRPIEGVDVDFDLGIDMMILATV